MAGQTPNYKLVKPTPEEFYDVTVPNGNMDKIDATLKTLSDALGEIDLVSLSEAISAVDGRVTQHLDDNNKHLNNTQVTRIANAVQNSDFTTALNSIIKSTNKGRGLVYSSVDTIIPSSTTTKMALSAVSVSPAFYTWNGTTNELTFLKGGTYLLSIALSLINPPPESTKVIYLVPRINGTTSAFGNFFPRITSDGGGLINISGTMQIEVTAGSRLHIEAFHSFTGSLNAKGQIDVLNLIEV